MELIYNERRLDIYEKRARKGVKLAEQAQIIDGRNRRSGKTLKVTALSQREEHVPFIRVAGKWLVRLGFQLGDEVTLTADEGQITIMRKENGNNGSSLV